MATRRVLADLTAVAAATGLPPVEIESVGGVDAARRVAAGEVVDLIILAEGALAGLATDGHVDSSSIRPLFLSQVAVAVPSGSAAPAGPPAGRAYPGVAELREAIRGAGRIGYSTGPSGRGLIQLIDSWGLRPDRGDRLVQARPGVPVARLLAVGEVQLGFQQLSELVGQPGVRILGVLPPDCAIETTFAGAVATTSSDPTESRQVLAFLASDVVAPLKEKHNFGIPSPTTDVHRGD